MGFNSGFKGLNRLVVGRLNHLKTDIVKFFACNLNMTILIIIACNRMFPSDTRLELSHVDAVCNKIILIRKGGVLVFWTVQFFTAFKPLLAKCAS
jgi:hypothetical protein